MSWSCGVLHWVGSDDVDIHAPSDHARRYTGRRYPAASHPCDYVHSVGDREGKGGVGALSGWDEYVLFFRSRSYSLFLYVRVLLLSFFTLDFVVTSLHLARDGLSATLALPGPAFADEARVSVLRLQCEQITFCEALNSTTLSSYAETRHHLLRYSHGPNLITCSKHDTS